MMSGTLDLAVTVRYYGTKARDLYQGSFAGIKVLKEDLLTLKMPHPKTDSITITKLPDGKAECNFQWLKAAQNGLLHRQLVTRIWGKDEEGARKQLLRTLSIDRLSLWEKRPGVIYHHEQQRRSDAAPPGFRDEAQLLLDDMASALKLPKAEPIEPSLPNASPANPGASAWPRFCGLIATIATPIYALGYARPILPVRWLPNVHIVFKASHAHEVRQSAIHLTRRASIIFPVAGFLNLMSASPKVPPPLPLPAQDSGSTPPGLTFSTQTYKFPQQTAAASSMQLRLPLPPRPQFQTHFPPLTHASRKRSRTRTRSPESRRRPAPAPPRAHAHAHAHALPPLSPLAPFHAAAPPPIPAAPPIKPAPPPILAPPPMPAPAPAPPAQVQDRENKVKQLTRELWDVRRQITAGVVRETAILSELKEVDALTHAKVLSSGSANGNGSGSGSGSGSGARSGEYGKREREREREGEEEAHEDAVLRTRLRAVEAELVAEKRMRGEMEAALEDVKRECREPFVVPAMFEAFLMVSKVTTQVMDSSQEAAAK
ncbi:hypothetical protein D9615_009808 [Tricholomella constricta]|uniref:Uncharacterized protein n=1 Tax=Tricholomella constricta TaxID=117010 RepID=A0A8H5LVK1_9AGAR|nr:hypothetical protein D9615_009808 [Tricholomella constricta]